MTTCIVIFCLALGLSVLLTPIVYWAANRWNIVTLPDGYRKKHSGRVLLVDANLNRASEYLLFSVILPDAVIPLLMEKLGQIGEIYVSREVLESS